MKKALEDILVVDLSRILAGPLCSQILGDLGANIIKVERPGFGDDTRKWGPPFLKDKDGNDTSESAYYLCANRNKRSIAIDITKPEGQALIHDLLAKADVLLHNFKVGGLDKYGLGYEDVHKKHPHIIYAAISGFGQTGPDADRPGYDFMAQALGGLMSITGEKDGAPMKVGVALSDVMTGLYTAIGILSALHARKETGTGQMVDVALTDVTLSGLVNLAQYYLTSGTVPPRPGNTHATIVPYQTFETSDGWVVIAVGNDSQFARFSQALGQNWHEDERFASNQKRVLNRDTLVPEIGRLIKANTTDHWVALMEEINVSVGPVNNIEQAFAMKQSQHRRMAPQIPHPLTDKDIALIGSPLKLSDTPVSYRTPPPTCGQHTDEILQELLNLDEDALTALKDKNII